MKRKPQRVWKEQHPQAGWSLPTKTGVILLITEGGWNPDLTRMTIDLFGVAKTSAGADTSRTAVFP